MARERREDDRSKERKESGKTFEATVTEFARRGMKEEKD